MKIKVINGGMLTTVQDKGRYGFQASGVQVSGVMDWQAAYAANLLVGNDYGSAVLECTCMGPELEFHEDCLVAAAGGEPKLTLDGQPAEAYSAIRVKAGQVLKLSSMSQGMRGYIAVAGAIDVPEVMGSCSTNLKLGAGGLDGRRLGAGDVLSTGEPGTDAKEMLSGLKPCRRLQRTHAHEDMRIIRVVLGPQDDYFTSGAIEIFLSRAYEITADSDRMGYRLAGEKLERQIDGDMVSDGIVFGSVQVPPGGEPIIMMADHQTTGGYPKVATVITADLPELAQSGPGTKVSFRAVSVEEAQAAYQEKLGQLEAAREVFENSRPASAAAGEALSGYGIKHYNVKVAGQQFEVSLQPVITRK